MADLFSQEYLKDLLTSGSLEGAAKTTAKAGWESLSSKAGEEGYDEELSFAERVLRGEIGITAETAQEAFSHASSAYEKSKQGEEEALEEEQAEEEATGTLESPQQESPSSEEATYSAGPGAKAAATASQAIADFQDRGYGELKTHTEQAPSLKTNFISSQEEKKKKARKFPLKTLIVVAIMVFLLGGLKVCSSYAATTATGTSSGETPLVQSSSDSDTIAIRRVVASGRFVDDKGAIEYSSVEDEQAFEEFLESRRGRYEAWGLIGSPYILVEDEEGVYQEGTAIDFRFGKTDRMEVVVSTSDGNFAGSMLLPEEMLSVWYPEQQALVAGESRDIVAVLEQGGSIVSWLTNNSYEEGSHVDDICPNAVALLEHSGAEGEYRIEYYCACDGGVKYDSDHAIQYDYSERTLYLPNKLDPELLAGETEEVKKEKESEGEGL